MQYIIIVVILLLLAMLLLTYFRFRAEISNAREKALAGSEILKTDHDDIEYAVEGEGPPVLLLHGSGGGYDQGLLFGKRALGDGFKFISVSRFGFLRSPMPGVTLPRFVGHRVKNIIRFKEALCPSWEREDIMMKSSSAMP